MASTASDFDADDVARSSSKPPHHSHPSTSNPYIRIQKRGRHYDVQTAITTFKKTTNGSSDNNSINNYNDATTTSVDLHSQIHFGDASYFQYFNDDATFSSRYDEVLYELIVEDKFLTPRSRSSSHLMELRSTGGSNLNPIAPTPSDRSTASQYGLQCQVDGIQYCKEGWVHADLTREEFLGWLEHGQKQQKQQQESQSGNKRQNSQQQPLWALASTSATYPGSELVTSLLRPLTTTSSNSASAAMTRQLFTHLFLPGDALSGWIRAILWFGVPSPELSIMLVDWSSLSYIGRRERHRVSEKDINNNNNHHIGPISPIAAPVFLSLLTGNWGTARRLVFGQVLVGGQSSADTSKQGVLIDKRNERAMEVLRETLSSNNESQKRIALLYGAGHCRDLHRRLIQEENMTPIRTEWRTAFRATVPRWGDFVNVDDWKARSKDVASSLPSVVGGEGIVKSMSISTLESVAVGLVILPLYLVVGGFDWVSTLGDVGNAVDKGMYVDGIADLVLYLVRHVALYVGISKFVVDWGGNEGIFEEE
ncbi:hypothetical protein ACHAXR_008948 [Thalassiosira sp. AJA248-18]